MTVLLLDQRVGFRIRLLAVISTLATKRQQDGQNQQPDPVGSSHPISLFSHCGRMLRLRDTIVSCVAGR
jgi:hypothetical protein